MKKWLLILPFLAQPAGAYSTVFNPFTGKLDFVGVTTATLTGNFIANRNSLQSGATFYVSSGTVNALSASSFTWTGNGFYDAAGDYLLVQSGAGFPQSFSFGPGNLKVSNAGTANTNFGTGNMVNAGVNSQFNTVIGNSNLQNITTGTNNFTQGLFNMNACTTGSFNFALGDHLMQNFVLAPNQNVMMGSTMGTYATTMMRNVMFGFLNFGSVNAVSSNDTNAIGYESMLLGTSQNENVADGSLSMAFDTTGSTNVAVGYRAGNSTASVNANSIGSGNTFLGPFTGPGVSSTTAVNNSIALGINATVAASNTAQVGGSPGSGYDVTLIVSSHTANGGWTQLGSQNLAWFHAIAPSAVGQMYYCSDCATDAVCISTGTATNAWARVTARGTACQ